MEQHAQTIDHTLAEPQSELRTQHSLERIVHFLIGFRYFFLVTGMTFLAWEMFEVFLEGESLSIKTILEVAMISVIGPALMWFGSRCAEGFAKQVIQSQDRLLAANQVAQREIIERERAQEALEETETQFRDSAARLLHDRL